jgi:hypothetical protein
MKRHTAKIAILTAIAATTAAIAIPASASTPAHGQGEHYCYNWAVCGQLNVVTVSASAAGAANVTAVCPAAEPHVVSGGFDETGDDTAVITASEPSGNGWTVTADAADPGETLTAYALCTR